MRNESRTRTARWRRAGFIVLCAAPILAAIPVIVAMWGDGVLFDLIEHAWWLILFGPTVIVLLLVVAFAMLARRPGRMPALERTPREGTVISHRMQSTGDDSSRRTTRIEYRAADGQSHRADLLEELTADSTRAIPPRSAVEVYAFRDPQYARTAVFLTEAHDDLTRQGAGSTRWGVDRSSRFTGGPIAGSPYVGSDAGDVFEAPAADEPAPSATPYRVNAGSARILVVTAWIVAGLASLFATTSGFGAFAHDFEVSVPAAVAAFCIALGAMFLDGGTADRRDTLARWSAVRLIGVVTLGFYVGAAVLLIPAAWGLVRRLTGGAKPRYEQRGWRNLTGLLLSTLLITVAVVGTSRCIWWSSMTSIRASSGIGIGVTYVGPAGSDELGEVAYVPYRLDGMPSYLARVAAVSLTDGALLWDRRLDSDPLTGFPVAVTSVDAAEGDPTGRTRTVVVSTEHGDAGLRPDDGGQSCGPATHYRDDCGIRSRQGALADTGESLGKGYDLYGRTPQGVDLKDGDTVLDPLTGEPAGDGFRIEYSTGEGVRIVVDEQVTARLDGVSGLQQVLVAPSGTIVLLMSGENNKDVAVIATNDGFRRFTIGDRGLVAWPAWMG